MKRVSIHDIAKQAGYSASTVSRALRDSDVISPAVKNRITKIAQSLGYVPNPVLSQLAVNRWGTTSSTPGSTLAYLCNHDPASKINNRVQTMEQAVRTSALMGYNMEIINVWGQTKPQSVERILKTRGITGIVIGYVDSDKPNFVKVDWSDFTVVSAGSNLSPIPSFHNIRASPFEQILVAGKRVFESGYRNVGMALIFHHEGFMDDRFRYGAYHVLKEEAAANGCTLSLLVLRHDSTRAEKAEQMKAWYSKHRPEVIIGFSPQIYWLLKINMGLSIPEDVAFCTLHGDPAPSNDTFISGLENTDGAEGIQAVYLLDILLRSRVRGIPDNPIHHRIVYKWREGVTLPVSKRNRRSSAPTEIRQ